MVLEETLTEIISGLIVSVWVYVVSQIFNPTADCWLKTLWSLRYLCDFKRSVHNVKWQPDLEGQTTAEGEQKRWTLYWSERHAGFLSAELQSYDWQVSPDIWFLWRSCVLSGRMSVWDLRIQLRPARPWNGLGFGTWTHTIHISYETQSNLHKIITIDDASFAHALYMHMHVTCIANASRFI